MHHPAQSLGAVALQSSLGRIGLRVATEMGLDGESQLTWRKAHNQHIAQQLAMPDQKLRICNAYAHSAPLEVYLAQVQDTHVKVTDATQETPIAYKECRNLALHMSEGDKLKFKAGNVDVGTFSTIGLPRREDTSLLLIPHRKAANSTALTFESHAFTDMRSPQLAVVDAYRGSYPDDRVVIMDFPEEQSGTQLSLSQMNKPAQRAENLKYNSVAALQPGSYQIALIDMDGHNITMPVPLHVQQGGTYLVMRVGNEITNASYPKELLVFAESCASSFNINTLFLLALLFAWANTFTGYAR